MFATWWFSIYIIPFTFIHGHSTLMKSFIFSLIDLLMYLHFRSSFGCLKPFDMCPSFIIHFLIFWKKKYVLESFYTFPPQFWELQFLKGTLVLFSRGRHLEAKIYILSVLIELYIGMPLVLGPLSRQNEEMFKMCKNVHININIYTYYVNTLQHPS